VDLKFPRYETTPIERRLPSAKEAMQRKPHNPPSMASGLAPWNPSPACLSAALPTHKLTSEKEA